MSKAFSSSVDTSPSPSASRIDKSFLQIPTEKSCNNKTWHPMAASWSGNPLGFPSKYFAKVG